ncbi:hypothetical protein ABZZ74_11045 [Streptomyces sp. NPDC006476]|uniref:ATP-binding protein n=1 Tax=Streptomyces sp. NPDC006476 TaxID=3157175 RepID=UPI0033BF8D2B
MPGKKDAPGPGNLPPDSRPFVGRRDELAWLGEKLVSGGRLLTLAGVGGVGKTRLALRATGAARDVHPDGVWLVELSALRAGGQVPLAVMETLRLVDQSTDSAIEALSVWARDKRLLLVLDSCEHLLTDCVTLVADLLAAAPGLRVLATSRERLGMPGERVLAVDALPVGDPEGRQQADAEALFVQRAVAVDPGFALDEDARPLVTDICRALDGIPLALELAAARLAVQPLAKLHELLTDRLRSRVDLLSTDAEPGEGPPRHRTLRTTIGWSHELCEPLERLLWARLSVFAGTFTTGAATWVCAGGPLSADRVAEVLLRLTRQSIVLRHPADPERFRLLDTVREYGAEWLRELGEEADVRRRHRDHYRRFAREACSDWNSGRQVAWCERVFAEQANLRAAVDHALTEPEDRVALEMAGTVGFLWRHCGSMRDAQRCLDVALGERPGSAWPVDLGQVRDFARPLEAPASAPELVLALWARAAVAITQGDLEVARDWAVRCADAARRLGDPLSIGAACYNVGAYLAVSGRQPEAIEALAEVSRLPVGGDWRGAALLEARITAVYAHLMSGAFDEARAAAEELRAISGRCGELWVGATNAAITAQTDVVRGDIDAARRNCRTALTGNRLVHNTLGTAYTLDALAEAEAVGDDPRRAARLHGISRRVWELLGRAQLDSPDLLAARHTREHRIRARVGDDAYEQAYTEGTAMSYDEGLDYALGSDD